MITKSGIYVIKDNIVGSFSPLINVFSNHAEAFRAFKTSVRKGMLPQLADNPGDFDIFCIGTIDLEIGKITPSEPELVAHAIQFFQEGEAHE